MKKEDYDDFLEQKRAFEDTLKEVEVPKEHEFEVFLYQRLKKIVDDGEIAVKYEASIVPERDARREKMIESIGVGLSLYAILMTGIAIALAFNI